MYINKSRRRNHQILLRMAHEMLSRVHVQGNSKAKFKKLKIPKGY